MMDYVKLKLLS